jgi:hypothetical protein
VQTYLVEHYRPGSTAAALREEARRVRAAAAELARARTGLRYVRSTIVPRDEAILSVLEAASEADVRLVFERAGVTLDRLSQTLPDEV